MQLNLFCTEEIKIKIKEGEETFHCRKCNSYLPEYCFSGWSLKQFRKKKGENQTQGAGNSVWCKTCKKEYTEGKTIAKNSAPPKPKESIPCDCCGKITEPEKLQLDHDHYTYNFRGWLCKSCNSGIGMLGDDTEGLKKAIQYLDKVKERYEPRKRS